MNELVQNSVVFLIVAWSLWLSLRRYAPMQTYKLQQALATWFNNKGFSKVGGYLSPSQASGGCDSGCGSCKVGCAVPVEQVQVVKFVTK